LSALQPPAGEDPQIPVGVLTVDRSLVIRTWSSWLETATGMQADDVCGKRLTAVIPDIEARGLLKWFSHVLNSGEPQVLAPAFHHYLIPCPPPFGSHFSHMQQLVTLGALREGDAVAGVMATVEDVTVRLDMERTLLRDLQSTDPAVRQAASEHLAAAERLHAPGAFTEVLREGDWQVRRNAIEGLMRHAPRDLLASLIVSLRDEHHNFNVLSSALQLLSTSGVDVVQPLAALLKDGSSDVRIQAALALGEHPGMVTVTALVEALADPDVNVRFHAIESLGRVRAAEGVAPLAAVAESGDFFLAFAAIDALVNIADPSVAGRLLPLLSDDTLSAPVAEALGMFGDGEVVRPLVRVLDRPAAPVLSVVKAVAALYTTYEAQYGGGSYIVAEFQAALTPAGAQQLLDALGYGTKEELRSLVLLLGWVQGVEVERALTQLLGRPDLRADLIEALVRHGRAVVDVLVDQLRAADEEVRLAAVIALGRLGDARATAPICGLLGHDRSLTLAAAAALASIGDQQAFEPLLPLLGHRDAAVRQAAIGALNSLGHPDMARRVHALLGSVDPAMRESAVRIAGYFGYAECAVAVFNACADEDESVRRTAIEHLPLFDEDRALPVLLDALRGETPRVRASAATALGRVNCDAARTALEQAFSDTDPWVRYFAARALAQHRHEDSLDVLAAVASTDNAPHVRLAALEAIGRIDGSRATALLAPYAEHCETELAVAAIDGLGHGSDTSGIGVLRRALGAPDPSRRTAAARALAARADPEGVEALQWAATADTHNEVVRAAFEGLERVAAGNSGGRARAAEALIALTADRARRESAIATLARVSGAHLERVAGALNHGSSDVRRAMIDVLTRSRDLNAAVHLRQALDNDDAAVREAAITTLDRVGVRGRGLSAKLAAIAAADNAATVRRAAAAVLSRQSGGEDDRGARG
jgi:HEAT repeat protein